MAAVQQKMLVEYHKCGWAGGKAGHRGSDGLHTATQLNEGWLAMARGLVVSLVTIICSKRRTASVNEMHKVLCNLRAEIGAIAHFGSRSLCIAPVQGSVGGV